MTNDYYDFAIAGHFLPALINDDYSGLDNNEVIQLDQWIDQWQQLPEATFYVQPTGTDFKTCDVCNVYAEVYDVRLYFHNDKLPASWTLDAYAD
jgi:hypothetical protein